jgi:hypothetical protein
MGKRVYSHRIYEEGGFDAVINGSAAGPSSHARLSFDSGHAVIYSWGSASAYTPNSSPSFWHDFYAGGPGGTTGKWDGAVNNFFARVEKGWDWGAPVGRPGTPGAIVQNGFTVPGSDQGGTKPLKMYMVAWHEPNVPSTSLGSATEFAKAVRWLMLLYDTFCTANSISTKHIKFHPTLSFGSGKTATYDSYYANGVTGADITKTGTRPADGGGLDVYFPNVEVGTSFVVTQNNEASFSGKVSRFKLWSVTNLPTNAPWIIPEFAVRKTTGTPNDDSYMSTFFSAMNTWLGANTLSNGDWFIETMSQFASSSGNGKSGLKNTHSLGGIDNSVIPDQTTYQTSYQNPNVSLRTHFDAFKAQNDLMGNPTFPSTTPPSAPTGVTFVSPTAGSFQTTITFNLNGSDSYRVYKDGSVTQSGLVPAPGATTMTVTVNADKTNALPQTHTFTIRAFKNNLESVDSTTQTITFTVGTGSVPAAPTSPNVSQIAQTTALAVVTPPSGPITGFQWFIGGSPATPPTSTDPQVQLQGLTPGSTGLVMTAKAFNAAGVGIASSGFTFNTPLNPDVTGPTQPGQPSLTSAVAWNLVPMTWTASVDNPGSSNEAVSGFDHYVVTITTVGPGAPGTIIAKPAGNTFTDTNPPASFLGPVDAWYAVTGFDAQGNSSLVSLPLHVTIPQRPTPVKPVPQFVFSTTTFQQGQQFSVDGSSSVQGTAGSITNYVWIWNDGGPNDPPSSSPTTQHTFNKWGVIGVQLMVTDSANNSVTSVPSFVIVAPPDGLTFNYTRAPKILPGTSTFATPGSLYPDINTTLGFFDQAISVADSRNDGQDVAITQTGNPSTPRRYNNAVYYTLPPATASASLTMNATTGYVVRCCVAPGQTFSKVQFVQVNGSPSAVTGTFFAVFDVTGALISPTGALTSADTLWSANQQCSYTLDGGPYGPPLGADDTASSGILPTMEFFIYWAFWTVGATHPAIASGSTFSNAINLGLGTGTPTQANILSIAQFGQAANGPTAAYTPPSSLGSINTLLADSPLIMLA